MKILLTGATGYIGKRLLPVLLARGYEVICCVRDKKRFSSRYANTAGVSLVEVDFLDKTTLQNIPADIDGGYYLVHSMSSGSSDFTSLEKRSADNFQRYLSTTKVQHVVYLSGIVNEKKLSKHLASRRQVEEILSKGSFHLTTVRAGIIIGSGSASFEIIRDLVEKLPVMVAPKWVKIRSQPIAIRDVISVLEKTLFNASTFDKNFDIGGPDVLTYKQMLQQYAEVRKLRRFIITVPVLTPKLSSYWLYFVTSVSYSLAVSLVESMRVEVVSRDNKLMEILNITPISYKEAVRLAFQKIEQNSVVSSWKDSLVSGRINSSLQQYVEVPVNGCFKDHKEIKIKDIDLVKSRIWAIGGNTGWYYASVLWKVRGFMDKLFAGVGLRRGRTSGNEINPGDTLDFWRVLLSNKEEGRLLLFAEMKLPGEAWLEFKIVDDTLIQEATFRPKGLYGRLYWYVLLPFHYFIFNGMIKNLAR